MGAFGSIPVVGGLLASFTGEAANEANRGLTREQMAWQERMSNTAHQREVVDLQKAGLNPNLSAGGNGASTPSPPSDTQQPLQNPISMFMPQIMQAMEFGLKAKQVDNETARVGLDQVKTAATIPNIKAQKGLTDAKTRLAQKGMVRADVEGEAAKMFQKLMQNVKDAVKTKSNYDKTQNLP